VAELEHLNASRSAEGREPSSEPLREVEGRQRSTNPKEQIRDLASAGRDRVVSKLDGIVSALYHTSEQMNSDEEAEISRYAKMVGQRIEKASRYLKEREPSELTNGLERAARERPLFYLGGTFVIGLLVGRFLKSHRREVVEESYARGGYDANYAREDELPTIANEVIGAPRDINRGPESLS
jgi:hypothetical protein